MKKIAGKGFPQQVLKISGREMRGKGMIVGLRSAENKLPAGGMPEKHKCKMSYLPGNVD